MSNKSNKEQLINVYLDDSGVLVKNRHDKYFVYGGYITVGETQRGNAHAEFKVLSDRIRESVLKDNSTEDWVRNEITKNNELKAHHFIYNKNKRALVKVLSKYESLACAVEIPRLKEYTTNDNLSLHRYKDYSIKRLIKFKLQRMILQKQIDPSKPTSLNIFIDEQYTSTNGFYDLSGSIEKEFKYGIENWNFGIIHEPIFPNCDIDIRIKFCDSKNNYMIQAADILANTIYTSFNYDFPNMRRLPHLDILPLP